MLVHSIQVQQSELALESSEEWKAAKAILDRIPSYAAKLRAIRNTMGATQQLVAKTERGSAALRAKLEDRERERSAKKNQDAAEFAKVVQR